MNMLESKITFQIPTNFDFETLALTKNNFTVLLTDFDNDNNLNLNNLNDKKLIINGSDTEYDRFIGDVWVGIILTIMIASSVFCMCACFLFHKYRQWKLNAFTARLQDIDAGGVSYTETESLPSYTIVSGLPSYDDALALEQLKRTPASNNLLKRPSLKKLFLYSPECQTSGMIYKAIDSSTVTQNYNEDFPVLKSKEQLTNERSEDSLINELRMDSEETEFLPQTSEGHFCYACGAHSAIKASQKNKSTQDIPWIHGNHSKKSSIFFNSTSFSSLDELLKKKNNENYHHKCLSLNFRQFENLNT